MDIKSYITVIHEVGWKSVVFDEYFAYNNTDNIQVLILKGKQEPITSSEETFKYNHTLYEGPENTRTRRVAWSQGEWENFDLLITQYRPY